VNSFKKLPPVVLVVLLMFINLDNRVLFGDIPVIAHIDEAPVHAIVSPVMFGFKDSQFQDEQGNSEMPIRRTVKLANPKKSVTLLIEGLLQSKTSSAKHANVGQFWVNFRCSRLESGESLRGPLASTTPIRPGLILHVIGAGNKLIRAISISDLMDGKQVEGATLIKTSFRQARLMFKVECESNIEVLDFDTSNVDRKFLGLLRAHVMCEPNTPFSVVFEDYGPDGKYESPVRTLQYPVGTYVTLSNTRPADVSTTNFRWHGQFLIPIGIRLKNPKSAMTNRWIRGLTPEKEVTATVRGLFIFSGFSVEGYQGVAEVGGGGGGQDFQFRFDHLRRYRPPIYPNTTTFFDSGVKIHWADNDYQVKCADGSWKSKLSSADDLRMDHTYRLKFSARRGSTGVAFEVYDGGTLAKTWDNAGGLFITVDK